MTDTKAPAPPETPRLVRAKKMVFYGGLRIRAGRTFTILKPSTEFSPSAMEYVEAPGARDDTQAALDASPKVRGSAGVVLKATPDQLPRKAGVTATPDQGPGI